MFEVNFVRSSNGFWFRYTFGTDADDRLPAPIFGKLSSRTDPIASIDRVYGRDGDDILRESPNIDHLFGGYGADVFMFTLDGGPDFIKDFEHGIDKIDLSGWGVTDISELSIEFAGGAKLSISLPGKDTITVDSLGRTLTPDDLTNEDFIFTRAIVGTDGNDKLRGGDDHDSITDAGGIDNMFGGQGMDIFKMSADGEADWIKDFNPAFDRVDVSVWGASGFLDLDVDEGTNGKVVIRYEDEVLLMRGAFRTLTADEIDASHFLF